MARYMYADVLGDEAYTIERHETHGGTKRFYPTRPGPGESTLHGAAVLDGVERLPYRLPELRASIEDGNTIYVTEGEKCAGALVRLGFVATTNHGGANWNWTTHFVRYFHGARRVIVLPDCDATGRLAARKRARLLEKVCLEVQVIEMDRDRNDGYDIADWIAEGHTRGIIYLTQYLGPGSLVLP